jgi:hypothetical protein
LRILSIVGTRPQLIKAAALSPVLRRDHEEILVDTGQHWDDAMAGAFFRELGLGRPEQSLGIGGGTAADQTGRMLLALERVLREATPDAVVVYGDTNSTLAGGLAAATLGLPVAHVEAGLRSFDRGMPEEVNRVVADHVSRWLFAPTPTAVANLAAEGIDGRRRARRRPDAGPRGAGRERGPRSGRARRDRARAGARPVPVRDGPSGRQPRARRRWPRGGAPRTPWRRPERPVVLALHPGTRTALEARRPSPCRRPSRVIEPQGYRTSLALQLHAAAV